MLKIQMKIEVEGNCMTAKLYPPDGVGDGALELLRGAARPLMEDDALAAQFIELAKGMTAKTLNAIPGGRVVSMHEEEAGAGHA
jgi:hypothetical protein